MENIASFEQLFRYTRQGILDFQGCTFVELYQDMEDPRVYFTYSHWESKEALEHYRNSEFFKNAWAESKKLFRSKPQAWSLHPIN